MEIYIDGAFTGSDQARSKCKLLRASKFAYRNLPCRNTQRATVHLQGCPCCNVCGREASGSHVPVLQEETSLVHYLGQAVTPGDDGEHQGGFACTDTERERNVLLSKKV